MKIKSYKKMDLRRPVIDNKKSSNKYEQERLPSVTGYFTFETAYSKCECEREINWCV